MDFQSIALPTELPDRYKIVEYTSVALLKSTREDYDRVFHAQLIKQGLKVANP